MRHVSCDMSCAPAAAAVDVGHVVAAARRSTRRGPARALGRREAARAADPGPRGGCDADHGAANERGNRRHTEGMSRNETKLVGPWLLLLTFAGCHGDHPGGDGASASSGPMTSATSGDGEGSSGDAETTAPPSPTTSSGASGGGSDPTTGGPDPGGTTGDPVQPVCGKLDLLFVIDSSSTMATEQEQLVAAFPAFLGAITETLGAVDLHVMAVSGDNGQFLSLSQKCMMGECTCGPAPTCCSTVCNSPKNLSCNTYACTDLVFGDCAFQYGSGRSFGADGGPCGLAEGARFFTSSDQADLAGTFACVAGVGTFDTVGDKKPMLAITSAVDPLQIGLGGCNEGFVRDDATLVVVVVSDRDDANKMGAFGSPGEPQEWHDALLAAKQGDEGALVVLGLVGDGNLLGATCDLAGEPNPLGLGAAPAPRIQEFIGLFAHGVVGSVCAADYAPFFTGAVPTVAEVCRASGG